MLSVIQHIYTNSGNITNSWNVILAMIFPINEMLLNLIVDPFILK